MDDLIFIAFAGAFLPRTPAVSDFEEIFEDAIGGSRPMGAASEFIEACRLYLIRRKFAEDQFSVFFSRLGEVLLNRGWREDAVACARVAFELRPEDEGIAKPLCLGLQQLRTARRRRRGISTIAANPTKMGGGLPPYQRVSCRCRAARPGDILCRESQRTRSSLLRIRRPCRFLV
jgi:hypothetical protein